MLHLAIVFALFVTGASAAPTNDWTIVPGKRVGPITALTTRADLTTIFGLKNVIDEDVTLSDEGSEPGTIVFKDQADASLTITWNDDRPDPRIEVIVFCLALSGLPSKCRWHTAEGITFGTTLKHLQALNGGNFAILGFGWDYGGTVTSWQGGRLDKLKTNCGSFNVRLDPPPATPSDTRAAAIEQVEGDREFTSAEPAMEALDPQVSYMSFSFGKCVPD